MTQRPSLVGRTVASTGGARGPGLAIARELSHRLGAADVPRRAGPQSPRPLGAARPAARRAAGLPRADRTTLAAVALGAVATSLVVLVLAAVGAASITGPTTAALALPALVVLAVRAPRAIVAALTTASGLLALGAAWTVLPLVDHHLLGAVAIDGAGADVAFHVAGWSALALALHRDHRATNRRAEEQR